MEETAVDRTATLAAVLAEVARGGKAFEGLEDALTRAERALRDLDAHAFDAAAALGEAEASLVRLAGLADLPERVRRLIDGLAEPIQKARARAGSALALAVAEALGSAGLVVEGQLPDLRAGIFRLRFRLDGRKPEVALEYGPGVAVLGKAPADPEKIASLVEKAHRDLQGSAFEPETFLRKLREAYLRATALAGERPGDWRAPIVGVLQEMAWLAQDAKFRADPVAERFHPYGRTRFSYDLARLDRRHADGEALTLGIATRAQAERAEEHIWVPHLGAAALEGTVYATLQFRKEEVPA